MFDSEQSEDLCPNKNESAFSDLYKYSSKVSSTQEEKRQLFLKQQKEKRADAFDEKRDLFELFETTESMDCESVGTSKKKKKIPFNMKMMQSEWLLEVPCDLTDNWLIKICPEGIRYLVVAHKAVTTCYLRNGKPCFKFKSNLPGGCKENVGHRFTVLDCIYNRNANTFFIYDILAWNSMSLINSEAHLRFFWLKSKLDEDPNVYDIRHPKNFKFVLIDPMPAEVSLLQDCMFTPFVINETALPLEGVLFYHKEGHYIFGDSPLVTWLKSYMLPEILHIDVPVEYMQKKPQDYECLQQYLSRKKKRRKIAAQENQMELEQQDEETTIDN